MGIFYIFGGLALLLFLFIFTKNNKDIACISLIPILFLVLIFGCNDKESQYDEFFEEYNIFKQISIEQIDDYADYEIVKKQEKINKQLKQYKNLCNSWFQGELYDKRFLDLKPIDIKVLK